MVRGVRCRSVAHDGAFDNQIARAANHYQMLDIVAADQEKFSAVVDFDHIHDRQTGLAAAPLCRADFLVSPARKRRDNRKQDDDDNECNNELCYQCPRPESAFKPTAHGRLLNIHAGRYPRRPLSTQAAIHAGRYPQQAAATDSQRGR
ncbi:MAG: hypothetical protein E2O93_07540 [Alphaproteobacteria bacterium]|nr:MAG: hypothetical protein E2O93_07540 [Alphaproteobacteria bacterium]